MAEKLTATKCRCCGKAFVAHYPATGSAVLVCKGCDSVKLWPKR